MPRRSCATCRYYAGRERDVPYVDCLLDAALVAIGADLLDADADYRRVCQTAHASYVSECFVCNFWDPADAAPP